MPIRSMPTEFNCPKCNARLVKRYFSSERVGLIDALLISPIVAAVTCLRCPKCGRIATDELSDEQRDKYKGEQSAAVGCSIVIGALVTIILAAVAIASASEI